MRNTPQDFSREYTKSAYLECPWCGMRAMELVIAWEKDDDRTVNCAVVGSAYVGQPDLAAPPGPHVCLGEEPTTFSAGPAFPAGDGIDLTDDEFESFRKAARGD